MKKILSTLALVLVALGAQAQNAYPLFAPSSGIMVGNPNTFITTSATGADVMSLFSGTCNATAFLRGDASCFDLFAAANTWSATQSFTNNGANARFNGADPRFLINETDGNVDEKNWLVRGVANQFNIATATDASPFSAINSALTIARSGTGVGQISLTSGTATVVLSGSSATATVGASGLPSISGVSTNGQFLNNDANPSYYFNESDAAADEKIWRLNAAAGDLIWSTRTDVNGGGSTFMTVGRTGTTVDSLALAATAITLNGVAATDYARLSQANVFTGTSQRYQNINGPRLILEDTDAALNEKCWFTLSQSSNYSLVAATDANCTTTTGATIPFNMTRTGMTIDAINLTATAINLNGVSSADYARLSQNNVFTNTTQAFVNTVPQLNLRETGATADEGSWLVRADGDTFNLFTATDASPTSAAATGFTIGRTGTTVTNMDLFSSATVSLTSQGHLIGNAAAPRFTLNETDGAADNRLWRIGTSAETLVWGTRNDLDNAGFDFFSVDRTGTVVDSLAFGTGGSTRFTIEGDGSWNVGGNGTSGQVLTSNGAAAAPTWQNAGVGDAVLANNQTFTGQNTFSNGTAPIKVTGPVTELENAAPILQIDESDAAANQRNWLVRAQTGQLAISTATDAAPTTAAANVILASRTGTTVDSIDLDAPLVTANSIPVLGRDAATSTSVVRVVSAQYKGGNTDRSSTATLAADPTLAGLSIPETGSYLIEGHLCFVGPVSGAGGIKMRYEFSGSVSGGLGQYMGAVNAVVVASGNFLALDANQISFATVTTGSGGDCIQFNHTMVTTGSGTLDLQWAQNASNANAIRMLAGSSMRVTRIG